MRKILWILLVCLPLRAAWAAESSSTASSGRPVGLGLGLLIGEPSGLTGEYWFDHVHSIDAALGFGSDVEFHADYLWHGWKAFPQPKEGKIAAVLGLGMRASSASGIRGVAGISYFAAKQPFEVFFGLAPVIRIDEGGRDIDLGVGVRYYFQSFN